MSECESWVETCLYSLFKTKTASMPDSPLTQIPVILNSGGEMMRNSMVSLLVCFVAFMVLFTFTAPNSVMGQENKKERKKRKKEEQRKKKQEKKTEKQIKKYAEAITKASKKYADDFEFRENVNLEYKRLRRSHARFAFITNTTDSADEIKTHSGDKIQKEDSLYDNLLVQNYVNRVGQSLVPRNSKKRYGFKVTLNPVPNARSLSTGTVYISSGLLSLIDNEAQLAYVLGHEIAHVEKDHWKEDVMVAKWVEIQVRKQERNAALWGAIGGGIFGALGGGKKGDNILAGSLIGASLSQYIFKLVDNKTFLWSLAQEDESDKMAMEYMLNRNYDVREVQTFYATMQDAAREDPRISLDFASNERTSERMKLIEQEIKLVPSSRLSSLLVGSTNLKGKSLGLDRNLSVVSDRAMKNEKEMSAQIREKLQSGMLLAGDGEFENVMATLKRDNGISAFYYDMYKLAARNLSQALAIRSDDALGHFYYGKLLQLTARKPGERQRAIQVLTRAVRLDRRGAIPRARLYVALAKMSGRTTNNIQEVVSDLKQYVTLYQRVNGGSLPPNMGIIYDYMQQAGETNWTATPVSNVKQISASVPRTSPANTKKTVAPRRNTRSRRRN